MSRTDSPAGDEIINAVQSVATRLIPLSQRLRELEEVYGAACSINISLEEGCVLNLEGEEVWRGTSIPAQDELCEMLVRHLPWWRRSTVLLARLAGQRRPHLQREWLSLLAGADGRGLPRLRRFRLVLGFLCAALRMRASDLAAPLWRPVDWLLASTTRTNTLITFVVGGLVIYFARDGGFHGVLADGTEPCAIVGGGLFVLTRWLRRVRGIELAAAARSSGEE